MIDRHPIELRVGRWRALTIDPYTQIRWGDQTARKSSVKDKTGSFITGFFQKSVFFLERKRKAERDTEWRRQTKGRLVLMWGQEGCMWFEKLGDLTTTLPLSSHTVISLRAVQAVCIIHRRSTEECITQSLSDCIPCVAKRGAWFSWRADRHMYGGKK